MPIRTSVSRPLLVLLVAAGAMTAACGHERASNGADAAAVPSSTPASATSPTAATAVPDKTEVARQKAEGERKQAAPPGVTITPSPAGTGTAEGSEKFGTPLARQGDVAVYAPRRDKEALLVPVRVVNSGKNRAFYRFRIRVTGAAGFDATASASEEVVGLYPGTSWPTELTVRDPGHMPPANPHITIVSVERDVYKSR
ncbi:hypothetical protein ACFW1F_11175 [Streptomyces bungoensis]|uniref:hypothetical protein n=1 Tax=Streptomyces bungoensis TaxID=285568 RepID=UPI00341E5A36